MKFLSMWWDLQGEEMKAKMKRLVHNGQLELVSGGWSMHDEACPTFEEMIDNMMKGHRFMQDVFNVRPRVAWQIDPFGHSNTNAKLFAEMGFDALILARIDYMDLKRRKA